MHHETNGHEPKRLVKTREQARGEAAVLSAHVSSVYDFPVTAMGGTKSSPVAHVKAAAASASTSATPDIAAYSKGALMARNAVAAHLPVKLSCRHLSEVHAPGLRMKQQMDGGNGDIPVRPQSIFH